MMLSHRTKREMLIAVGIAGTVVAMGAIGLILTGRLSPVGPSDRICALDRKIVFERSAIGRGANAQFNEFKSQKQADLVAEKNRIDQAIRATPADGQQLLVSLQQRVMSENARLEALRTTIVAQVMDRVGPAIRRVGDTAKCGAIIDRSNFVYVGRVSDLTSQALAEVERDIPPLPPGSVEKFYQGKADEKR
jgi:Skp family chaperone for outer membrane proteins